MSHPPLGLLCIEPTFPGRLGGVADWLVRRRGYRVRFYCQKTEAAESWPEATGKGIEVVQFPVGGIAKENAVDWTRVLERGICYSYGCWEALESRRPRPVDIVLWRSNGLGSSMFAPVTLAAAPIVQFFDSYYEPTRREPGIENDTHPEAYRQWRRAANAIELVELENGVSPWTPTEYQRSLFPAEYRDDFTVLHDGVETRNLPARHRGRFAVGGRTIPDEARVVTFVARSLTHTRGFDRFVAMIERLQDEFPDLIAVAAGGPLVQDPLDYAHYNRDYAAEVLAQHPRLDRERLWLTGLLRPDDLRRLLARSDLHIDVSRPRPASRSLVEALAAGCVVLASHNESHREFIDHERNGILVADDSEERYVQSTEILRDRDTYRPLGEASRQLVRERYARDVTLPRLAALFERLRDKG
jgi:glycosyltransferase involved in cell wall biosynthesis